MCHLQPFVSSTCACATCGKFLEHLFPFILACQLKSIPERKGFVFVSSVSFEFNPLSLSLCRTKEAGGEREALHTEHMAKRPCTVSPSQRFSPSSGIAAHAPPNGLPTHPPNGLAHPSAPGPQQYRLEDMAMAHHYRDAYRHSEHRDSRERHRQTGQAHQETEMQLSNITSYGFITSEVSS